MIELSEGRKQDVNHVKFGKDRKDALVKYLEDEHSAVEAERSSMRKRWDTWVQQSNSRLKRKDAGPRDSQIDMSLTRERLNQSESRLVSPIFQSDQTMVGKPRTSGPNSQDLALAVESVMDFILDRSSAMEWTSDWSEHFHVLPFGVVKTGFTRQIQYFKRWEEIDYEQYLALSEDPELDKMVSVREFDDGSERYFVEVEDSREERAGVFPEAIPPNDFLFKDAVSPDEADWVTHRLWLTKAQLNCRVKNGIYGKDAVESLGSPETNKDDIFGVHNEDKSDDEVTKRYDIRETYLSFDVDGKGEPVEIIVTWERTKRVILRAVYNFYHGYARPFVVHQFKHVVGSMYGTPLTFDLEYPHKAYSASINQRLDAASKALEKAVFLPPNHPLFEQADVSVFRGGLYENPGFGKEDIQVFSISEPSFSQLPQLEQIFEMRADRVAHIPPQAYGLESADRPTATGTMGIMEQAQFPQNLQLERFRKSFALVVKHMLSRYRQFYPEGLKYYAQQDPESMALVEKVFEWPSRAIEDDVLIETKVSSSTMSKMIRKQEIVALMDKMPQIYQTMYQMAELASNPMNPAAIVAAKYLEGMRETVDMFFKEFDVGQRDQLNPELAGGLIEQNMAKLQQMVQQLQQQNQQLMQQGQSLQAAVAQKDEQINAITEGLVSNPAVTPGMG